jgi:hypothetical protein
LIKYHASEGALNQVMGGGVTGLVLMAPVRIAAGILVLRRHVAGPVLALGPAFYALYMYSQLALGGDFFRYPGNTERFFPPLPGTFHPRWSNPHRVVDADQLRSPTSPAGGSTGRWWIVFLVVAGFLAVGLHLPGLLDAWSGESTAPEYLADPQVFWLVKSMDLGLVFPGLGAAGIGILRGGRDDGRR